MAYTSGKSINDFIKGFNGGTRLNRFSVTSSECTGLSRPFHVRAAQIPGATITSIGLNWFGKTIELPGERVYAPWAITILDDVGDGREVHSKFVAWQNSIAAVDLTTLVNINQTVKLPADSNTFGCHFQVDLYRTNLDTIEKSFKLFNVWPVQVGGIELDMSKDNILGQFTVIMMYSHFEYQGNPTATRTTGT